MKRSLKKFLILSLFLNSIVFFPVVTNAQVDPLCDPGCNCRPDGSICPIDNGVYVLLLIGIGYGIYKIKHTKKATLKQTGKI
jgi:hypothetical protein